MDLFDLRLLPEFASVGGDPSTPALVDQICIDSRRISSQNALFIALKGHNDGHDYVQHAMQLGAKYAIVSQDWAQPSTLENIHLLRVPSPLQAFQSLVKIYRSSQQAKVIAIAGTYGKTMVKDLLHLMLSNDFNVAASPESFNSQIGVPLSLLTIETTHDAALIEASISEKREMETLGSMITPDAIIITPIGKKHLATLKDIHTIERETLRLLDHAQNGSWVLLPETLNKSQDLFEMHSWDTKSDQLPHAELINDQQSVFQSYLLSFPDGFVYQGKITTGFYYFLNLINITAKAAWLLGISSERISSVIAGYHPEPMRTEIWKSQQGATFINDSYCGDPQSIDQAFKLFQQSPGARRIFIFGGLRKKSDASCITEYKRVGNSIAQHAIDQLILVGPHPFTPLIDEVKSDSPFTVVSRFDSYETALKELRSKLKPLDLVLIKGENKQPLDMLMETFNDSISTNQCIVNLDAVKSNIARLRGKLSPQTRLMIMVKAFAYGTGELQLAKFLSHCGIDILGVSNVDEAVALKHAGVPQNIFIIHAAPYESAKVVKWGFEVGVSDEILIEQLDLETQKQQQKVKVHLHINTGMGRFGCRPEEALKLTRKIINSPLLELEGIMTHFAAADDPLEDDFTFDQAKQLDKVIQELSDSGISIRWKHACNSCAAARFSFPQYNMVRIGLALYGLHSFEDPLSSLDLRQAISLTSRIVGINTCKAGETISYGRSYTVTESEQRIAILPLGYFDGLHRIYSNKGHVLIQGFKAPIVGKICMDYMMVNITHIPSASIGDPVLIFGEDEYSHSLPAHEFASKGNSIVHELITCLGPRIPRIFIHEEKE
jgi:Alr-MurF fusion protein